MEPRGGKETIREIARKEAEENNLKRRKDRIRNLLESKRFPPTHQTIQTASQRQPESEGKEDTQMKEESKEKNKGYLPVNLHFKKKHSWKSRKKCWYCHSPYHLKKDCNQMQCFYCRRLGHLKANCFKRKLDYIFKWLWKMAANAREIDKRRNSQREHIQALIEECKFIHSEDSFKLNWKNKEIGEYNKPGTPIPFRKLLPHPDDIKLTEVVVKKGIPIGKLKLLKGFSNWCFCGQTGLTNKEFLRHIKVEHNGMALPTSVLNRPPWIDWVDFFSDEAEVLFSGIDIGLT